MYAHVFLAGPINSASVFRHQVASTPTYAPDLDETSAEFCQGRRISHQFLLFFPIIIINLHTGFYLF